MPTAPPAGAGKQCLGGKTIHGFRIAESAAIKHNMNGVLPTVFCQFYLNHTEIIRQNRCKISIDYRSGSTLIFTNSGSDLRRKRNKHIGKFFVNDLLYPSFMGIILKKKTENKRLWLSLEHRDIFAQARRTDSSSKGVMISPL